MLKYKKRKEVTMGCKGRHNVKKPKRISFLAKGVKPKMENLKEKKPIKIAFLGRIKRKKEVENNG